MARFEADFIKRDWVNLTIFADTHEDAHRQAKEHLQALGEDYELDYLAGPFPEGGTR